jgi:hypothetical protein
MTKEYDDEINRIKGDIIKENQYGLIFHRG